MGSSPVRLANKGARELISRMSQIVGQKIEIGSVGLVLRGMFKASHLQSKGQLKNCISTSRNALVECIDLGDQIVSSYNEDVYILVAIVTDVEWRRCSCVVGHAESDIDGVAGKRD